MKHDLIVFGEDWGALPSSTQHLVKQLATQRKIVWVNSIGLRRPKLNWHDIKRSVIKITGKKLTLADSKKQSMQTSPCNNIHIIHPRTLPAPRSLPGRWLAARLLISQIMPIIKMTRLSSPVLWISLPTAVDIAGKLGESALLYYCGDDFSALAGVDHATVAAREKELSEKADIILSASKKLQQKFPSERSFLLPHGVNYTLFSKATPRAPDLPDDGRPVAGFYGSISTWLDIDMLQSTIQKLTNWHFVFIGKPVVDINRLSALPNVHLLGERPHHQLASYSQHWTASLLPFVNNAQIQACNPLKLNEYLAAGRPVISTTFAAIDAYRGLIQVANTSEALIEALNASLTLNTLPTFSSALQNSVSQHSWSARAHQASQWIEAL